MFIEHPLFMTLITLTIFRGCEMVHVKSNGFPVLNPVLVSIILLISFLIFFDIPYSDYKEGTEILHLLLAPAIIALAVPLYHNLKKAKEQLPLVLSTIALAGVGIISSAVAIGAIFGLPELMIIALTTKSVSAPIALEISALTGGSAPLAIIGVFSTGLTGVIIVPPLLKLLKVKEESMQGLVLGITAHAFGIARALSISPLAAAFATLGMGLMGCFAVVVVPLFLQLINI